MQVVQDRIYILRGFRVMLDFHLAEMYGVEPRVLNQSVSRNKDRFPSDFMFRLTTSEWKEFLNSSQIVMSSQKHRGMLYLPYAFTEQGVAMLSSVLRSNKAIAANIAIMRAFVVMRQSQLLYKELKQEISKIEKEMNLKFKDVNEVLEYLLSPKSQPRQIGFKQKGRKTK